MAKARRTVLITGCSDGGLGAALAEAFHNAGHHVYATARNPGKMQHLKSLGIETIQLNVLSKPSIEACVKGLDSLDILVNNAGQNYPMPVSDMSIQKAKELFDLNVWSYIEITQAFLPLLLKSEVGIIVNHTSTASVLHIPFQAAYNASKAAIAMVTDTLRLELQPFGVKVVDLRTGLIRSNLINNLRDAKKGDLPEDSIYAPAKEVLNQTLIQQNFQGQGTDPSVWANGVVSDVLKRNPPLRIWRGEASWLAWFSSKLPFGLFDGALKKAVGMDKVEPLLEK